MKTNSNLENIVKPVDEKSSNSAILDFTNMNILPEFSDSMKNFAEYATEINSELDRMAKLVYVIGSALKYDEKFVSNISYSIANHIIGSFDYNNTENKIKKTYEQKCTELKNEIIQHLKTEKAKIRDSILINDINTICSEVGNILKYDLNLYERKAYSIIVDKIFNNIKNNPKKRVTKQDVLEQYTKFENIYLDIKAETFKIVKENNQLELHTMDKVNAAMDMFESSMKNPLLVFASNPGAVLNVLNEYSNQNIARLKKIDDEVKAHQEFTRLQELKNVDQEPEFQ